MHKNLNFFERDNMANFTNLLKKSINLGASALLLVSTLLPTLGILSTQTANAATTTGVGTLTPGSSWDTGNHAYSGQQNQASNYTLGGNDSPSKSGNWLNLVNNDPNKVGYGIFNGSISTNSSIGTNNAFVMSASIKVDAGTLGNFQNGGDAIGFILTPASAGQLAANISQATGPGLGISGLSNSYFLGRDLFSNLLDANGLPPGPDGQNGSNGWYNGGGNVIAIRNTLAGGTLNPASYPSGTTTNTTTGQAWMQADDSTALAGVTIPGVVQEPISMSWTPDTTNSAPTGFNSGTLTFSLTSQNKGSLGLGSTKTYTLTTHCNLQDSMSMGFVAGTGGNYSNLSVSLNGGAGTIGRGTEPALVNYVNSTTGKAISSMTQQSTIIANVSDVLGVLAPGSTATSTPATASNTQGTFNYVAPPAPAGYTYDSTQSITVANFVSGTTNPNVLNIQYTPKTESGQVGYWYLPGTPGTATMSDGYGHTVAYPSTSLTAAGYTPGKADTLPAGQALSGGTDAAISFTPSTIPTGYHIDHVIGPDNQSYPSFAAALAANPNYTLDSSNGGTNAMANSFVAVLAADSHSATYSYTYASNTPGANGNAGNTAPALPNGSALNQAGVTGTTITDPSSAMTTLPAGYAITNIIDPSKANNTTGSITSILGNFPYISTNYNNFTGTGSMFTGADSAFQFVVSAQSQSGKVNYSYVNGTPGVDDTTGQPSSNPTTAGVAATLPATINLSGLTNATMTVPTTAIPQGYTIDHVVAPDGNSYASVSAAQAASTTNAYYNVTNNNWTVYLKALVQTPSVSIKCDASGNGMTQPAIANFNFVNADGTDYSALTGTEIPASVVTATQSKINTTLSTSTYDGWSIYQYADPSGQSYGTPPNALSDAVSGFGGYIVGVSNNYTVQLALSGELSMSVPNSMDFGSHQITGAPENYIGSLNSGVTVSDSRTTSLTGWTISIAEDSHLAGNSVNLMYNNQNLTSAGSGGIQIYTASSGQLGTTNVLAANSSAFSLNVPADVQTGTYTGQVTWTLSVAP
ncbi:beta strand repeat-containing protein [Lactococcus nasutitermitis]|uniref:Beta strand repeat-containing protein n=1 Tax=Lactococcus nasutitermitis TaxID=1652957 RepID=A0ABV9JBQ2_9LACT|nr:hypothetical protein [Lactococcus nasutitermitis]